MKTTIRLVITTLFISTFSSISSAQASTWRMSEDPVTLGMNGASAHVEINNVAITSLIVVFIREFLSISDLLVNYFQVKVK